MHGVPPGGPVIGEAVGTRVPGLHSSSAALGWGDWVSPRATALCAPAGAGEARGRCRGPVLAHGRARRRAAERGGRGPAVGALTLAAEGLVRDFDVAAALGGEAVVGGVRGTGQEPGHREV